MSNQWLKKLSPSERRKYHHEQHIRLTKAAKPRICIICGELFQSKRKPVKTCSPRCTAYLIGLHKIRLTKEQYTKAAASRSLHPITGPFETNHKAKYWSLKSPNGGIHQFWNMSFFVREHKNLFNPKDVILDGFDSLAAHQLRRLRPDRKNHILSWKGWKWRHIVLRIKK